MTWPPASSAEMPVVLDAPFGRYLGRDRFVLEAAERLGWPAQVRPVVVHVRVDGDVVRQRVTERGLERDTWKLAHWDEFWGSAGAVRCTWLGAEHLWLDNSTDEPDLEALAAALGRD